MDTVKWRFRKMSRAEENHDPMERELFEGEPINTRLVREAIQNSLDAGANAGRKDTNAPVRMRFSLAGIHNPLSAEQAAGYFDGLADHLNYTSDLDESINERLLAGEISDGGVPFLVIEDAGTTGLIGNWEQYDDSVANPAESNHFYWFFRNIGRSGKRDADNGSWGLGKWVFPDASRISSYIAVTRRSDDGDTLLMGQSVLTKHTIGPQRYAPYGYLAVAGVDGQSLPLRRSAPEHQPFIDRCIADFGLQLHNEPGLSVIIPFPRIGGGDDDGIGPAELIDAIARNYFYPVIAGRLVITLDAGDGSPPVVLDADTIDDITANMDENAAGEQSPDSYRKLFAMCRECITLPETGYHRLPALPAGNADADAAAAVINLRPRYENGELLAFHIGADVQRKKGERVDTAYRLYLQRDDALAEGQDYYVRGTLSIPGIDSIRRRPARALLVVDENEPLAAMLRDSEPASHTTWRPQTRRVTDRWVAPSRRITAVRNAPATLLNILEASPEGLQKDAFADIFFWDGGSSPESRAGRQIGERTTTYTPKPPKVPRRPQEFEVTQSDGGFRVRLTAAGIADPPACAGLRVAYAVSKGNPFSRYRPEDFRLHGRGGALSFQMGGCRLRPGQDGNAVFLDIDDPGDFEFAVSGFDPTRDVRVSIDRVKAEADAEAGA